MPRTGLVINLKLKRQFKRDRFIADVTYYEFRFILVYCIVKAYSQPYTRECILYHFNFSVQ